MADDVRTARNDVECKVAQTLDTEVQRISGIGASDCDCATHLHFALEKDALESAVRDAHKMAEH